MVGYLFITYKGEEGKEGKPYSLLIIYDALLMVVMNFFTLRELLACFKNTY
jgi:hypothetical protein